MGLPVPFFAAKMIGKVVSKEIDKRYFGGHLGEVTHLYSQVMFYYSIYRALTITKRRSGKAMAEQFADALREAIPVRTGRLRDSVRVVEGKNGNYTVKVGGTPETMIRFSNNNAVFDLALGIEYGTTKRAAHPYFRPTQAKFKKQIEQNLIKQIQQDFG